MPKAISTRYRGATSTRGSVIIASDSDNNRLVIPYPHELNADGAHRKAAEALRDKMGWSGELIDGGTKTGRVFVFAPTEGRLTQLPFSEGDVAHAEQLARRLGFGSRTAYTSSSQLIGLFCQPSRTDSREGCIIKTREIGFMFVQCEEDI